MRRAVCFALLALVALAGVAHASELESTEELDMQLADAASAEMEALHVQQLRVNAVPLCMDARGEDVDVASLKKASGDLLKQLALVNEKLVRKPGSRALKQQQHCIREVLDFQDGVVKAIAKFGPMKVPIEKEANDVETKLLNLPCELEEGDHVDQCEALTCKVKALRAKAANVQSQAETTYRIHSLRRRVIRYEEHVKQIRETKQCPSQAGGHKHKKEREPVMMEFSAHAGHSAKNCPKKDPWQEHWMICLDRAEQRMQQLKSGIATLQGSIKAMEVKKFPKHCTSKKKAAAPLPRVCNTGKKSKAEKKAAKKAAKKAEKKKAKKRAHKKAEGKKKKHHPKKEHKKKHHKPAHVAKRRDPPPAPAPKKSRHYQGRAHAPFQFSAAIASGDPHVDTFDRFHHDTMISGWFTWAQNSVITVQAYSQLGCMPPSVPNTCIRAVVVRIVPPDSDESLVVSFGYWAGRYQNVVIRDSHGRNVDTPHTSFKAGAFLGGKFGIAVRNGQLQIGPNGKWIKDPALAINVVIAPHLLVVTLPRAAPHMGATNGLFGFFHAPGHKHVQSSFRMRDGSHSGVTHQTLCQRCGWGAKQQPALLRWAASHVVSGPNGPNPPIGFGQGHLKQTKYLNSYHQRGLVELEHHIKHNSLLQLNQTLALAALHEAAAQEFSPFPKKSKPVILASFVPKVTMKNLKFCRNLIKGALKQTAEQKRASQAIPWWKSRPCVSEKQLKDIKAELAAKKKKAAAARKKFTAALNSCLQDAANKKIAKTVATAQKTAKKAVKKATKALVKVVKKAKAKARAKQAAKAAGKPFNAAAYNKINGDKKKGKKMIVADTNGRHRGPIGLLRDGQGARDLDHELRMQEEMEARLRAEEEARRRAEADIHHVVGVRVIHHSDDDGHGGRHGHGDDDRDGYGRGRRSGRYSRDHMDGDGHGRFSGRAAHHTADGFWVGALAPKHTTREYKLCPDCQPIVYNSDSPLSDHDIKLMRAQYAELVLGGVKLHGQDTLDRAELMVGDAELFRKKLLDQYPPSRTVVMEDGGDAESD